MFEALTNMVSLVYLFACLHSQFTFVLKDVLRLPHFA